MGTSGRIISSAVPMRKAARSRAGMRATLQPLANSASSPSIRSWCSSTADTRATANSSAGTGSAASTSEPLHPFVSAS